jgi:hypothetical protein
VGALFQGQFSGKPGNDYQHLLQLCIYIHADPVKCGLALAPEEWEYSNHPEWMGRRDGTLVDREFVGDNFGTPAEYSRVVMNCLAARELPGAVQKYLDELESQPDFRSLEDFGSLEPAFAGSLEIRPHP